MDSSLLTPLIKQLDDAGDTSSVALARVLEFSNRTSKALESLDKRLEKVEEQTTKTNGRVLELEKDVKEMEGKMSDDYEKLHSPLIVPIAELQKDVGVIKSELEFRKRISISAISVGFTLFVVFGATWWEKIAFFASLNEEFIRKTVALIIQTNGG